jgi:hypothetical protein
LRSVYQARPAAAPPYRPPPPRRRRQPQPAGIVEAWSVSGNPPTAILPAPESSERGTRLRRVPPRPHPEGCSWSASLPQGRRRLQGPTIVGGACPFAATLRPRGRPHLRTCGRRAGVDAAPRPDGPCNCGGPRVSCRVPNEKRLMTEGRSQSTGHARCRPRRPPRPPLKHPPCRRPGSRLVAVRRAVAAALDDGRRLSRSANPAESGRTSPLCWAGQSPVRRCRVLAGVSDPSRHAVHHLGQDGRVGVCGDRDRRVTEHLRERLEVRTAGQGKGCGTVRRSCSQIGGSPASLIRS